MRFVLITDKTPKQCIKALNDRIAKPATKTRTALQGWADKDTGRFRLSIETTVYSRFKRRTRLTGKVEKISGQTTIRGFVPSGFTQDKIIILAVFVAILSLFMFLSGQLIYAILIAIAGAALTIPLKGDDENHDLLLYELEKATKAKPAKD